MPADKFADWFCSDKHNRNTYNYGNIHYPELLDHTYCRYVTVYRKNQIENNYFNQHRIETNSCIFWFFPIDCQFGFVVNFLGAFPYQEYPTQNEYDCFA